MADPVTWAIIGTAVAGASAGYSAYTSRQQAKAEEGKAEYNREMAEQEAKRSEDIARAEVREAVEEKRRFISMQTALYGKSGVAMKGTPLRVMGETAKTFARERQRIGYAGQVRAARYRSRAAMYKYQATSARRAGYLGIGESLIGGAAQVGQIGLQYKLATA